MISLFQRVSIFLSTSPLKLEGLGTLFKHYRQRFFRYLDPNGAVVHSFAVVKLYFEINPPNCTRVTHWHVLFNMCTRTRAFLSGRATVDGSGPFPLSRRREGMCAQLSNCGLKKASRRLISFNKMASEASGWTN